MRTTRPSWIVVDELAESYLNGNLSWVYEELNKFPKGTAMSLVLSIYQRLGNDGPGFARYIEGKRL